MITLHHLENSQSFRVVWLLEELGMLYNLKTYKRQADNTAPPEYRELSPLGTSPVIVDGNLVLCESNAILDYLLDQAPSSSLRPTPQASNRADYLFWYHSAQGTFQPNLSIDSLMRIIPTRVPWPISIIAGMISSKTQDAYVQPRLKHYLGLAEKRLAESDYLVGSELTAADITSIYPMDAALHRYPSFPEQFPRCQAWFQRLAKRKAFKRAQEKVGEEHVSLHL